MWDRITVTGIVIQIRFIRGFARGTHNTLLIDCGHFAVKLVSGRTWSEDVELGDEITVSGEVRGHEDWHGWSATVLSDTQPVALPASAPRPSIAITGRVRTGFRTRRTRLLRPWPNGLPHEHQPQPEARGEPPIVT